MKRGIVLGYGIVLTIVLGMQSCQDDPITVPTDPTDGIDSTWVSDSTDFGGGNDDPSDSTDFGGGNDDPSDSTDFGGGNDNPSDSTDFGWGNDDPSDSSNFGGGN